MKDSSAKSDDAPIKDQEEPKVEAKTETDSKSEKEPKLLAAPTDKEETPKPPRRPEPKFDFKPKKRSFLFSELSFGQFLFTMVLILVVGLGVLGGIFYLTNPSYWHKDPNYAMPVTSAPLSLYLDVNNPEDELLVFESAIIISGKTTPNANIVLSTTDNQSATQADALGEFSKVFSLTAGMNLIQISAFDDMGNSKTELRRVYYSSEKIE